jgi:hypothetical protein
MTKQEYDNYVAELIKIDIEYHENALEVAAMEETSHLSSIDEFTIFHKEKLALAKDALAYKNKH